MNKLAITNPKKGICGQSGHYVKYSEYLLGYRSKTHTLNFLALFWDSFLKICSDFVVLESEGATIFIESMSMIVIKFEAIFHVPVWWMIKRLSMVTSLSRATMSFNAGVTWPHTFRIKIGPTFKYKIWWLGEEWQDVPGPKSRNFSGASRGSAQVTIGASAYARPPT